MATYFLFGKYSAGALQGMSAQRTEEAKALIKKFGGEVKSGYALLGEHDLVLIVDLPGTEQAMKASVALAKLTGIAFATAPAVSVADFDKLMAEV
ncbi:MAG: GYD domain-containing protein [Anaerolineae bacterium]|nr:GYD domain-containing protein [Anaerolineae bacterium]